MTAWNEELEQKYIEFFETFEGKETERSYYKKGQVLRGIECGEGWKKHVEQFLETLVWIKDNYDYYDNPKYGIGKQPMKIKGDKPKIKIFQIKEKFGDCRCYVTAPPHAQSILDKAVAKLEAKCSITCEVCGKLEYDCIKNNKGWIYCLCKECFDTRILKIIYH